MKTRIAQNDTNELSGRGLRAFTARHQMVLFLLLTYLISWSFVIPADGALIPYCPMIAAFIVLAVVAAVSALTRGLVRRNADDSLGIRQVRRCSDFQESS